MNTLRTSLLALILFGLATGCDIKRTVGPADSSQAVVQCLQRWKLFGPVPTGALTREIKGIQGFSESDGFHGDGTDWYELELSPSFANDLRTALGKSTTVNKSTGSPYAPKAPSWWPTMWPADAKCYSLDLQYLVLPDTGTRAWYMQVRT